MYSNDLSGKKLLWPWTDKKYAFKNVSVNKMCRISKFI